MRQEFGDQMVFVRGQALQHVFEIGIPIGIGEYLRMAVSTFSSAASLASDHRPRSVGEMRPSGTTAVASRISKPAPDSARWPR